VVRGADRVAVDGRDGSARGAGEGAAVLCAAVLARVCVDLLEGRRDDDVPGSDADVPAADGGRKHWDGNSQIVYTAERARRCVEVSSARAGGGGGASAIYATVSAGRGRSDGARERSFG